MDLTRIIGGIETRVKGDTGLAVLARGLVEDAAQADGDAARSRHVNTDELRDVCLRVLDIIGERPGAQEKE